MRQLFFDLIGNDFMDECFTCSFYDSDYGCTCADTDKLYACPYEYQDPENQKKLEEYEKCLIENRGK